MASERREYKVPNSNLLSIPKNHLFLGCPFSVSVCRLFISLLLSAGSIPDSIHNGMQTTEGSSSGQLGPWLIWCPRE